MPIIDVIAGYVQERQDISSVFLLTDGEATVGPTRPEQIVKAMTDPTVTDTSGVLAAINGTWKFTKGEFFKGTYCEIKGSNGTYLQDTPGESTIYKYTNVRAYKQYHWNSMGGNTPTIVTGRWHWEGRNDHAGTFQWTINDDDRLTGSWRFDYHLQPKPRPGREIVREGKFEGYKIQKKLNVGDCVQVKTKAMGLQRAVILKVNDTKMMGLSYDIRFDADHSCASVGAKDVTIMKKPRVLPCTVNTFGYGDQHNDRLLREIAKKGSGMYYYIGKRDECDESFGDCLGGLLTMLGKDVKMKISANEGVQINGIQTTLPVKVIEQKRSYEIDIGDIQGEETRNLIVDVKLPKALDPGEATSAYTTTIEYYNLLSRENVSYSDACAVPRGKRKRGEKRSVEIDAQENRMLVAEILSQVADLREAKAIEAGKKRIMAAIEKLKSSASKDHASTKCLIDDLKRCSSKMHSVHVWRSSGCKSARTSGAAHSFQRSSTSGRSYRSHGKGGAVRRMRKSMKSKGF